MAGHWSEESRRLCCRRMLTYKNENTQQLYRTMKTTYRLLASLLLIGMIAGTPAWADEESPTVLRVMCFNIHHGRGMDDVVDLIRTANVIKEWKPDLVAIQEVDRGTQRTSQIEQPKILGELTEMHYVFGKAIDHQGGDYGLVILSRFPIIEDKMVLLPQEGQREQRGLQIAKIGIPDEKGKVIRFANTHLGLTQTERATQFERIKALLSDGDEPVILAGDFNARPENALVVDLLSTWKDTADPALEKNVTPDVQGSFGRIDFIFFRAKDPFKVLEHGTIDDAMTSDHKPIFSVLTF